uniref:Uncharacterized protein n=1 Tax=Ananas comosus var. bracteatus TaxID=296719 RepID=A0A6V7PXM3_ANACO|nr:unnamed protein product [Ananas comosus var. bracteatus]
MAATSPPPPPSLSKPFVYLDSPTLHSLLAPETLIPHLRSSLPSLSLSVHSPPRVSFPLPSSPASSLLLMPSWSTHPSLPYLGVKVVTSFPSAHGVAASYSLFHSLSGAPSPPSTAPPSPSSAPPPSPPSPRSPSPAPPRAPPSSSSAPAPSPPTSSPRTAPPTPPSTASSSGTAPPQSRSPRSAPPRGLRRGRRRGGVRARRVAGRRGRDRRHRELRYELRDSPR